jgi:hypothetical protein
VPGPWRRRNRTAARSLESKRRERRLQGDAALVAEHYPGLTLERTDAGDAFVGKIVIGSASGIATPIDVRIELPPRYPDIEPIAIDAASRFPHNADAHIYPDGSCCLWLPWESPWNPRRPDGIVTFIDHVVQFFYKQLIFEANGHTRWPGEARGHGAVGFKEFVSEALAIEASALRRFLPLLVDWPRADKYQPCPCESGKKVRWCHGPAVMALLGRVGRDRVERRAREWLDDEATDTTKDQHQSTPSGPLAANTETGEVPSEEAV